MEKKELIENERQQFMENLFLISKTYIFEIQEKIADVFEQLYADITIVTIVNNFAKYKELSDKENAYRFYQRCKYKETKLYESCLNYAIHYQQVFYDLIVKNIDK